MLLLRKRRKGKMWSKVSPHLLVAGSDQEDHEDEEHDGPQSDDKVRKVGHQIGNEQQLLDSGCRRIVDGYAL